MKKIILIIIFAITSLFVLIPVNAKSLTVDDMILVGDKSTSNTDLDIFGDNYDPDQNCEGDNSLLGNPNDSDSVAWLLNQILSYTTLIGMILVVVLSSIDFLTVVVTSNDDAMAKAWKKLGLRLIFAILLFFVPTITNAMLDIFGLTSQSTCGIQQ